MINADRPAFPVVSGSAVLCSGMSLRDHFAGLAMQGELASQEGKNQWESEMSDQLAKYAYKIADAMLKARATGASHE